MRIGQLVQCGSPFIGLGQKLDFFQFIGRCSNLTRQCFFRELFGRLADGLDNWLLNNGSFAAARERLARKQATVRVPVEWNVDHR